MEHNILKYLVGLALTAYPTWRIIKRTGLNQYWAALIVIPGIGMLVIMAILAFSDWPVNTQGGA